MDSFFLTSNPSKAHSEEQDGTTVDQGLSVTAFKGHQCHRLADCMSTGTLTLYCINPV